MPITNLYGCLGTLSEERGFLLLIELRHSFRNPELLDAALTHRSAATAHNERLEFLGDALLGFIIADELCSRHPQAAEGPLTRTRASLVNRETLAEIAREIGLGGQIHLGEGERKSGGWRRSSILANALEAVIAAIYLDSGLEAARAEILGWFQERLLTHLPANAQKDAKTELQEYLQARRKPLPTYTTVDIAGPPHQRTFRVACALPEETPAVAEGDSRRRAEQSAARLMLETITGRRS